MQRHRHLHLFIHRRGHPAAAWRHPAASPWALSAIRYYQALAQQRVVQGLGDSWAADAARDDRASGRTEVIRELVRREQPTRRQLLARLAGARGHHTVAGTPEQVAALMADWCTDGAADGGNIMPPVLPVRLEVCMAEVMPLLQRRGLFRTAYEGDTLRAHYGLVAPARQFGAAESRR